MLLLVFKRKYTFPSPCAESLIILPGGVVWVVKEEQREVTGRSRREVGVMHEGNK